MALIDLSHKIVIVKWTTCKEIKGAITSKPGWEMRIIHSAHPAFQEGERFDYGKLDICIDEGYTVVIEPLK